MGGFPRHFTGLSLVGLDELAAAAESVNFGPRSLTGEKRGVTVKLPSEFNWEVN